MKAEPVDVLELLQRQGHLRDLDRPKARLKKAALAGIDLSRARLAGADLSGADLSGANLSHADLSGATLNGANLSRADLSHADLRRARLRGADLSGAKLEKAQLNRVVCLEARFHDADLSHADLSDADLNGLELTGTSLREAVLKRANLGTARLTGVDLTNAHLEEVFFERAVLEEVDLTGADLTRANLVGLELRRPRGLTGARFKDADLAEATLEQVSFEGADLSGAILDQVTLKEVSLEGAILTRADFQGVAGLTEEQIQAIRSAGGIVNAVLLEKLVQFVREHRAAKVVLALVLLAAVGGVVFYYQNPAWRPVDQLLAEAQALRNDNRPEEALKIYDMLLPRVKDRLDQEIAVLYEKAETLSALDRPAEAAALYALIGARTSNDRDESINAQLKQAAALSEAGEYEKAIQSYKAIAEDATNSPKDVARALVALSQTYQKMGFEDRALEIFQETLKRFPHDPEIALEVNLQMAEVYIQRQMLSQAETLLSQLDPLVRDDSQRAALLIQRARLFEEMGNKEKSLATFEELVKRYPENPDVSPEVKMDLAQLMVDKGEFQWATRIYKDILARAQDRLLKSQAQIQYGILLRQLGQTDKALELFRLVRRQATDNPDLQGASRLEEAETLVALKKYDEALELLNEAIQSADSAMASSALLRRGQILFEMGRVDEAKAVFEQVSARFGKGETSVSAQMDLAMMELSRGDGKKAVELYEQMLKDPASIEFRTQILTNLGQAYLDLARDADAERTFNALLQVKEDSEARANGRFGLARLAARQGDRAKAVALYKEAAADVDDLNLRVTALDSLARLHAEVGEVPQAIEAFQLILNAVPERHDAAFAARQGMAELFEGRREFDKAENLYKAILENAERGEIRAGALLALGRLYLDRGDANRAMQVFSEVQQKHAAVPDAPFQARLGLAQAFKLKGEPEKAILAYQKLAAEVQDPRIVTQALDALSQLYQETGRADEALKVSEQLLARAGHDAEANLSARLGIAASHRQKGEYKKALEIYGELKAKTSDRNLKLTIIDALAQTYAAMGNNDLAASAYEEIVNHYKDNQDTLHNAMMGLAGARRGQGRRDEAVALYQRIVAETPDQGMKAWALESLAQTYQEAGQKEKALEVSRQVASSVEKGGSKLAQADLLKGRGDTAGALKLYEEAAASDPEPANQAWALVYAAQILSEQEKNDDALERYLKVIEKHAKEAEPVLTAKLGIASIYRARNRLKESTARYEEIARGESFADYRVQAGLTAAELYLEQDQRPKAKALYEQLLKRFADQPEAVQGAKLGLARIMRESGQHKEALAAYQALAGTATDASIKASATAGMARSYADLGQRDKAQQTFQSLKSSFPDQLELVAEANAYLSKK